MNVGRTFRPSHRRITIQHLRWMVTADEQLRESHCVGNRSAYSLARKRQQRMGGITYQNKVFLMKTRDQVDIQRTPKIDLRGIGQRHKIRNRVCPFADQGSDEGMKAFHTPCRW